MPVDYTIAMKGLNPKIDPYKNFQQGVQTRNMLVDRKNALAHEGRAAAKFQDYTEDRTALEEFREDPTQKRRQGLPLGAQVQLGAIDASAQATKKTKYEYDQLVAQSDRDTVNRRLYSAGRMALHLLQNTKQGSDPRNNGYISGLKSMFRNGEISKDDYDHYASKPASNMALQQMLSKITDLKKYQTSLYQKDTAAKRNLDTAIDRGYKPGTPNWKAMTSGGGQNVTVQAGETAAQKAWGTGIGEEVLGVVKGATASRATSDKYRQIVNAMDAAGVYTGKGGEAVQAIRKIGTDIAGIELEGTSATELLQSLSKSAAADIKKMFDDRMMNKGELEMYLSIPPNILMSRQGAHLLLQMAEQSSAYDQEASRKVRDLTQKHGTDMNSIYFDYQDWRNANPRWSKEVQTGIMKAAKKYKNRPLIKNPAYKKLLKRGKNLRERGK